MKQYLIIILLVVMSAQQSFCQQVVSAVSDSKYVNITKDPPKPPYLEVEKNSIEFTDDNKNRKIDANESAIIRFKLVNSGAGQGLGLKVVIQETTGAAGISYSKEIPLSTLDVGKSVMVEIPVSGQMLIHDGKAEFSIKVNEPNGFGTDPVMIEVPTQAFQAPKLQVVDYKVSSQAASQLQKRKPFDLEVLIQNIGQGAAEDVGTQLIVPNNVYCLSANENFNVPKLDAGEIKVIIYNLITNNDYLAETIPFTLKLSEKYGKYSENKTIQLAMNQPVNDIRLTVEGKSEKTKDIVMGSLVSSVDKNIPVNQNKNPNRIALIIGNENYSNTLNAEINVEYARHDADIFRNYALALLGVEKDNLFFLTNASAGQMQREIDRVTELVKRVGPKAELIFYYAGHGFPDEVSGFPYLIPVDVDATNLYSAIKLSDIYQKFSATDAARITIFLDACFSGGGRNQGLLAARSVKIKPKHDPITGNMVVFSASSGEQSALPFDNEKHGLFTYYLLKKFQESAGQLTYQQLGDYLKTNVGQDALRYNGKPQDPEVQVSPSVSESWQSWKFN